MAIQKSEWLQKLAKTKDANEVREAADDIYELDVTDCDDVVGTYESGIKSGLMLAAKVVDFGFGGRVFEIRLDNYADDDAVAYFVGTEQSIAIRLKALKDSDKEGGEEDVLAS